MPEPASDQRVRLISQGYNTWKMQILFTKPDMPAAEISERLRDAKRELARQFGVPDNLLEYTGLLGRQETRNGLLVQLQITKQDVPANAPRFRTEAMKGPDGTAFSDMILLADLHPYDEYDHPLTKHAVEARLNTAGFPSAWIDWPKLEETIDTMRISNKPIIGLEISRGILPSTGKASRVTYGVRRDQERMLDSAWIGIRPVSRNEFIAEVSTSSVGLQWGRNVYGRELEPRPGLQTRLEAGDGTTLTLRGQRLVAAQDGLLVFERFGRDRRDKDAFDLVPVKILGRVLPVNTIVGYDIADLTLNEAAAIMGSIPSGARIRSTSSLFIDGDVEKDVMIECAGAVRIMGYVRRANIRSTKHVCIHGDIADSDINTSLTLYSEGRVIDSKVRASDVIAEEIRGGDVEALRQPPPHTLKDSGSTATAIRINLRKFFEMQQIDGRAALEDLRGSLSHILDIFGPDITLQASEGTEQRLLLKWLRKQKAAGIGNYTHAEVQEFREVLELIPRIREQLTSIGLELREVTTQLESPQIED